MPGPQVLETRRSRRGDGKDLCYLKNEEHIKSEVKVMGQPFL